ncbi:hypothetical protein ACIJUN_31385 (plasmid) [Pseudomonas aeruginosa]|uniref:hypothetical protein n=1 Tax=Pseudomonas aeruginosa TaxID=287 RepID=UPI00399D17CE
MRFPRETERFAMAALLLNKIQGAPEDLSSVRALQSFLLRQIITAERRVKRLKKAQARIRSLKRKGSTKQRSSLLKLLDCKTTARITNLQQMIFLWKCFGDGLACVYQSTYSLKHLYFDADYEVKSDPGFLLGKIGFMREYRLLRKALVMNVPALLADLTNVIRHGDVCLMGAADPVPLEVKSSSNRNARTDRQTEQRQVLHKFFRDDGALNFRGVPNTKRVAISAPPVSYEAQINECMSDAWINGVSTRSPEPGLTYLCAQNDERRDEVVMGILAQYPASTTLFVALTPEPSWLPHKSFTASLSPVNTVLFMQERLAVLVVIDLIVLKHLLDERSLEPVIIMDGSTAIQVSPRKDPELRNTEGRSIADDWHERIGVFRISEFHFLRTATQFESLRWFADTLADQMEAVRRETPTEINPEDPTVIEVPVEWQSAKDCFAGTTGTE